MNIALEPTNICNAKCIFCPYTAGTLDWRAKGIMDKATLERSIEWLRQVPGIKRKTIFLQTAQGDVTLHPNLESVIAGVTSVAKSVKFVTNGIALNRHLPGILRYPISEIKVSTTISSAENYKRYFGVDRLHTVLENLTSLRGLIDQSPHKPDLIVALREPASFVRSTAYSVLKDICKPGYIHLLTKWDDWSGLIDRIPEGHDFPRRLPTTGFCFALVGQIKILLDGQIAMCTHRLHPDFIIGSVRDTYGTISRKACDYGAEWLNSPPEFCVKCQHYRPFRKVTLSQRVVGKIDLMLKNHLIDAEIAAADRDGFGREDE